METNKGSTVFMTMIKIGLLVYTMIRSIDLAMSTMPDSIKLFAIFVVCGLDVALLAWDDYTANPHKARAEAQHNIGVIMIVLNMLGIAAAVIGDSARIVDPVGSRDLIFYVSIYGIAAMLLLNIGGLIGVKQLDPDRAEIQAAAKHARELARLQADHDRKLEIANRQTELDIAEFRNREQIQAARRRYHLGEPDLPKSDNGHTAAMSTLATEGEQSPKATK